MVPAGAPRSPLAIQRQGYLPDLWSTCRNAYSTKGRYLRPGGFDIPTTVRIEIHRQSHQRRLARQVVPSDLFPETAGSGVREAGGPGSRQLAQVHALKEPCARTPINGNDCCQGAWDLRLVDELERRSPATWLVPKPR